MASITNQQSPKEIGYLFEIFSSQFEIWNFSTWTKDIKQKERKRKEQSSAKKLENLWNLIILIETINILINL